MSDGYITSSRVALCTCSMKCADSACCNKCLVEQLTSRAALRRGASPGAVAWASGKLRRVVGPLMARAALSYSLAASSAVSKVPSHSRTFFVVSRISAAYFPHGLSLTPRYLAWQVNMLSVDVLRLTLKLPESLCVSMVCSMLPQICCKNDQLTGRESAGMVLLPNYKCGWDQQSGDSFCRCAVTPDDDTSMLFSTSWGVRPFIFFWTLFACS